MVFSFWNVAGRLELAASTGAKRVKSRGPAGLLRMATAIRGMPVASRASSPAPKKKDTHMGVFLFWSSTFAAQNRSPAGG